MNTNTMYGETHRGTVREQMERAAEGLRQVHEATAKLVEATSRAHEAVKAIAAQLKEQEDAGWRGALAGVAKGAPQPMPTYPISQPAPILTNPVAPVAGKPKNLTNEARALIQTGHSYERAVQKLQAKYPTHPSDNVRRAVGRARDGK